jgi:CBS domain-containing protein
MSTKHVLVEDVMTRAVVSARADALFKEIAAAMVRNGISLVPVLGDGRQVLGVVSAADLLARVSGEHGEIPRGHRLAARHEQHRKVAAATAVQLMTEPAVTVPADTSVREAARRCGRFHVRCMPVLDRSAQLVGIVSRSDLLKPYLRDDAGIQREITQHIIPVRLLLDPAELEVGVREGVVSLAGELPRRSEVSELVDAIGELDGVVAVHHQLSYRTDDIAGQIERPIL